MSRTKEQTDKHPSTRGRWPIFVVVGAVLFGVLVMVLPRNSSTGGGQAPPKSLFTKEGVVSIKEKTGKTLATIDVEVADTEEKRETGLMGRPVMDENQGMLFIFEREHLASFWMRNTILSLDMLFVNAKNEIVTIHRNTTSYSEQTYTATAPVIYVLEVNAGFCERHDISEGDVMEFRRE